MLCGMRPKQTITRILGPAPPFPISNAQLTKHPRVIHASRPQIGGGAANFTYDFEVAGCAAGVEVDYVIGGDAMHIDMNVFSANDWRLAWLLVLPGWNWLRGTWRRIREGGVAGGAEEVVEEELMEEEEGDDDDGMMMM
eukprot:354695-Chlamydomonas_euryale.AAC.2